MLRQVIASLSISVWSTAAVADVLIFDCTFPDRFSFYATIYDDGSPARIGVAQGVGNKAQAYFDELTGAWILVEFIDGGMLPSTLTTILQDGTVWRSRHTLFIDGKLLASQESGTCNRNSIR